MVQVSTYDTAGRPSRDVLAAELNTLSTSLRAVHTTASRSLNPSASPRASLPSVPDLLIRYVENGRNPDIYTREFVELVRRLNQLARGKELAFVHFRDVLAREMASAMPELRADVERVIECTGGREPIPPVVRADGGGGDGAGRGESGSGNGSGGEGGAGAAGRTLG
jgi:mediator of RNA polymerase II transcription subunit 10